MPVFAGSDFATGPDVVTGEMASNGDGDGERGMERGSFGGRCRGPGGPHRNARGGAPNSRPKARAKALASA